MSTGEYDAAMAYFEARKETLEHCARCGRLLPFTPPASVSLSTLIYCGRECADLARRENELASLCPACGEPDPGAEHDDRADAVHAGYRQWADDQYPDMS
jgi:ribosomal protein S27AE